MTEFSLCSFHTCYGLVTESAGVAAVGGSPGCQGPAGAYDTVGRVSGMVNQLGLHPRLVKCGRGGGTIRCERMQGIEVFVGLRRCHVCCALQRTRRWFSYVRGAWLLQLQLQTPDGHVRRASGP